MLLEGSARRYRGRPPVQDGQLIVVTRDAPLTAIVSSGAISFSGAPDVSQAFVAPIDQAPPATAAASVRVPSLVCPQFPYVAGTSPMPPRGLRYLSGRDRRPVRLLGHGRAHGRPARST